MALTQISHLAAKKALWNQWRTITKVLIARALSDTH
jgi:hypothetical protein